MHQTFSQRFVCVTSEAETTVYHIQLIFKSRRGRFFLECARLPVILAGTVSYALLLDITNWYLLSYYSFIIVIINTVACRANSFTVYCTVIFLVISLAANESEVIFVNICRVEVSCKVQDQYKEFNIFIFGRHHGCRCGFSGVPGHAPLWDFIYLLLLLLLFYYYYFYKMVFCGSLHAKLFDNLINS